MLGKTCDSGFWWVTIIKSFMFLKRVKGWVLWKEWKDEYCEKLVYSKDRIVRELDKYWTLDLYQTLSRLEL